MPPNEGSSTDFKRFAGPGTYGEGTIGNVLNYVNPIRQQYREGKISQGEYLNTLSQVIPQAKDFVESLRRGGSSSANSVGQGGVEVDNLFREYNIYSNAKDILGRDITENEFAQIAPRFGTGNKQDIELGRAYLAQFADQEANSPDNLRKKGGQFSGDVNTIFNDLLQRGASQEEINHFGGLLASGEVDPYTLRQFVQQLPEYTSAQDAKSRESLNTELTQYDQDFFNKGKENVLSRYAQAGIQNSPSLDFALTNLMGDIQKQRSSYLAGLAREDYSRGRDVQRQDYTNSMNRLYGQQDYSQQRGDAYSDLLTNRAFGSIDYQRQQDDLLRLLNSQPRQGRGGIGGLLGGLAGAGIGGYASKGKPQGVSAGYQIGSGIGGYFS